MTNIIHCPTREAWLAERRKGIGGSDAGVVMGYSHFSTPYQLWLEKSGQTPDQKENDAMEWGRRHEPTILAAFAEHHGHKLTRLGSTMGGTHLINVHPERPWQRATLDDECLGCSSHPEPAVVQAKFVTPFGEKKWKDGPPREYLAQVQHEMDVAGYKLGFLVALFSGYRLEVFPLKRHDAFADAMVRVESRFWQKVVDATPPERKTDEDEKRWLNSAELHGAIEIPAQMAVHWRASQSLLEDEKKAAEATLKRIKAEKDQIDAEIKRHLAQAGAESGGYEDVSWKLRRTQNKGYVVAPFEYTSLRYTGAKPKGVKAAHEGEDA